MDALFDRAPCGLLVVGDDGGVRLANATAAELLGRDAGSLVGRHVDGMLTTASRIFYQTHVFPTLRLQGRVHEVYLSFLAADGTELPMLLNARRHEAEGHDMVSDWAIVPMRQRNEYENQILAARRLAEDASRAKDQFLALVTHELRSPLAAIRNWAAILSQGKADATMIERAVAAIERNVRVQANLVDDILDQVRVSTGKLRLALVDLDTRTVVEGVVDAAASLAAAKGVSLERDIAQGTLPVRADPDRLQQVFWNIVNNAIKFTPAGGRVRVAQRREGNWVETVVSDTGRGISPEFLPHVFERFRQAEGSGEREGGLGLGMAITRELVELHAGSIVATSAGPGQGATFTVCLPLIAAVVTPAKAGAQEVVTPAKAGAQSPD